MQVLESERLRMRAWNRADAPFVFDMYSRWDVQRFIGTSPRVMQDVGEALAAIERWTSRPDPVFGVWAVEQRENGRLLGTLLLKPIPASSDHTPLPPSGDVEIGWHFHPDSWGHGYATEAGARGLAHAFDAGLPEVVAVTNVANTASQRVALRIGMVHRGRTDRYYNTTCELFTAAGKRQRRPAAAVGRQRPAERPRVRAR